MCLPTTVRDSLQLVDIDPHDGCVGTGKGLLQGRGAPDRTLPLPSLVVAVSDIVQLRQQLLDARTDVICLGFQHIRQHVVLAPLL